jgi:hypothetical protein
MMKTMIAAALLVLASTCSWAQEERTITCDGPYRGRGLAIAT